MSIYCYNCERHYTLPSGAGEATSCPQCGDGFIEVFTAHSAQQQPRATPSSSRSWAFNLPGGGGHVRIMTSSGSGIALEPSSDFVNSILGSLLNSGMVDPSFNPAGGLRMPAANQADEQQWLDQIVTRLMDQYQPTTRRTAARVLNSLPILKVRAANAERNPGEGEAQCKAGESCVICTETFAAGDDVMELPCNHAFHEDCVKPWLRDHNTCPVCRLELPSEDGAPPHHQQQQPTTSTRPGTNNNGNQTNLGQSLHHMLGNIAAVWERYAARDSEQVSAAENNRRPAPAPSPRPATRPSSVPEQRPSSTSPTLSAAPSTGESGPSLRERRAAAAAAAERRSRGDSASTEQPAPPQRRTSPSASSSRPTPRPSTANNHRDEGDRNHIMSALSVVAGGAVGAVAGRLVAGWLQGGSRRT